MKAWRSSTRRDNDRDRDQHPAVAIDLRLHRGNAHVGGQRLFETVEQVGPRKRTPLDQQVGLVRRRLQQRHFVWSSVLTICAPAGGTQRLGFGRLGTRSHLALPALSDTIRATLKAVNAATMTTPRRDTDADGAVVVEGPRGEVRAQHRSGRLPFADEDADERGQPSSSSGDALIRSTSAAAARGSTASTAIPSRSSRLRRTARRRPAPPPPAAARD